MARQQKTPKQRAEEALGAANRKVVRLERDYDRLAIEHATKKRELTEAVERRDYLKQDPALRSPTPQSTTSTTQEGTNQ